VLGQQLGGIGDMLLAAAARAKIPALGRHPLGRRLDHSQQFGAGEILFELNYFRFHRFSRDNKGNKDNELINAANAFSAEGKVLDLQV